MVCVIVKATKYHAGVSLDSLFCVKIEFLPILLSLVGILWLSFFKD